MLNYLSFLCYADWIFCINIQKRLFIVWTYYVYSFLPPFVLSTDGNFSVFEGGIVQKILLTHREMYYTYCWEELDYAVTKIYTGASLNSKKCFKNSKWLSSTAGSICMIWSMKNNATFLLYSSSPFLLPSLWQKQSGMLLYHCYSLLPSNDNAIRRDNYTMWQLCFMLTFKDNQ